MYDNQLSRYHTQYSNFTALGQPGSVSFPKPGNIIVNTTYTYYPQNSKLYTLLTQKLVNGSPVESFLNLTYQYDLAGNIVALTDAVNNVTHTYAYDPLNRLLTATGVGTNAYTQTYTYDLIGNLTYNSDVGTYTYYYNDKPHAVRSTTGTVNMALTYDANGNVTSKTGGANPLLSSIIWNEDNKPVTITANGSNVNFVYDGNGNRVMKTRGANATYYFGEAYEMRNGVGTVHLFANHQRIATIRDNGPIQYYHGNHLGSASVVTDQNGNLKQKIEYFPYGTYRAQGSTSGTYDYDGAFPNVKYTFTDQEDDDETGLYNYDARLYDPQLGRFISADTVVPKWTDTQSLNRYSYCENNPLKYIDPSGHEPSENIDDCYQVENYGTWKVGGDPGTGDVRAGGDIAADDERGTGYVTPDGFITLKGPALENSKAQVSIVVQGPGAKGAMGAGAGFSTSALINADGAMASANVDVVGGVSLCGTIMEVGLVYTKNADDIKGTCSLSLPGISITGYFDKDVNFLGLSLGGGPGFGLDCSGSIKDIGTWGTKP